MNRKGAIAVAALFMLLWVSVTAVSATSVDDTYSWDCGLRIGIHIENHDYWILDEPNDLFLRITLLDRGTLAYLGNLEISFYIDVGIMFWESVEIVDPWVNKSSIDIMLHPTIQSDWMNQSESDWYLADYYIRLNQTGRYDGATRLTEFYTILDDPHVVNLTENPLFRFWPYPPIILMAGIYWLGFYGLIRFNRRYDIFKIEPINNESQSRSDV